MKIFRKLLSLFLAFLFVLQLFPLRYIGNFAVEAFALESNQNINGYNFDIPKESDNTINVEIPETIIEPEGYSYKETAYEYEYDEALSENENRFLEIIFENTYFSELTNDEKAFVHWLYPSCRITDSFQQVRYLTLLNLPVPGLLIRCRMH